MNTEYIKECNEKLRLNNADFKIGDKLSDNRFSGNDAAWVNNKTNTSIEVFAKAKSKRGVDANTWYSMDVFNRHFKKYEDVKTKKGKVLEYLFSNDEITTFIDALTNDNANEVERYKTGDKSVLGFFMKNLMAKTKGNFDKKFGKNYLMTKLE